MIEEWKDIREFENKYQVSNLGNVKSLDRYVNSRYVKRIVKGRILKNTANQGGYHCVHLCKNPKTHIVLVVHRLVAETFIENIDNKPFINHIDGVKTNNLVTNLEWCTHKENMEHASSTFLMTSGSKSHLSKLDDKTVIDILKLRKDNMSVINISKLYKISCTNIYDILNNRIWKHINRNV